MENSITHKLIQVKQVPHELTSTAAAKVQLFLWPGDLSYVLPGLGAGTGWRWLYLDLHDTVKW